MTISDVTAAQSGTPVAGPTGGSGGHPTSGGPASRVTVRSHGEGRRAVALVLALTAGLSLILAMFVSIAVNSGANGIKLAVAGPPPAVEQIRAGLTQTAGADAFDISVISDEAAARAAMQDRSVDGAIVIGPDGPKVLTASAGSPAISQLLSAAAAHLGNPDATGPPVVDVVPLPSGDSRGVGLAAGSLPIIIAGLALGAAAGLGLRSRWMVLGTVVAGAMAIAVSFAGVLAWLGVSGGHFWAEASAITLAIATSALVVAGLVRLVGAAGAGLGALLLVIIGNPLSGIATSPRLLPGPWGEVGQWLPTGAGGTLVRSASYFPEASVAWPVATLLVWATLGAAGVIFGKSRIVVGHGSTEPQTVVA